MLLGSVLSPLQPFTGEIMNIALCSLGRLVYYIREPFNINHNFSEVIANSSQPQKTRKRERQRKHGLNISEVRVGSFTPLTTQIQEACVRSCAPLIQKRQHYCTMIISSTRAWWLPVIYAVKLL